MSARSSSASAGSGSGRIVFSDAVCTSIGEQGLLNRPLLALFCSIKCPGELILRLFDFTKELRDRGTGVVSGFHAPMDRECFDILLRGKGPIVWCPARSIEKLRLTRARRMAVEAGRLLVLSPFPAGQRRITPEMAEVRNRFVVSLAERVFVAFADPGGKTEALCRKLVAAGKPLLTFDSRHNQNLLALGAQALESGEEGRAGKQAEPVG